MDKNDNELLKLVPFLEKLVEMVSCSPLRPLLLPGHAILTPLRLSLSLPPPRTHQNEDVRPHVREKFRLHDLLPPD